MLLCNIKALLWLSSWSKWMHINKFSGFVKKHGMRGSEKIQITDSNWF